MQLHFGTLQIVVAAVFAGLAVVYASVFAAVAVASRRDIPAEQVQAGAYALRKRWLALLTIVIVCGLGISFFAFPYPGRSSADETVVQVTAGQFFWSLVPNQVPAGAHVRFDVTSVDVNHGFGFYDPHGHLIGSVQAMPGYHNRLDLTLDEAGSYVIRCLEYCGLNHARMETTFTVTRERAGMTEAAATAVLHPRTAESVPVPRTSERGIGLLFAGTGIAVFALMGVFGLVMRLTQATVLDVSQAWFYRLMTVHGAGMLTGALLAMMGALWFVLRATVPLSVPRMLASYVLILIGATGVIVSVLVGGFAAGWTFLTPLPFHAAGQWSLWATTLFLAGLLLVGLGFFVFCADVLATTTSTYGGLARTLGIPYLRGLEEDAPPPHAIAATVVSIDGLLASGVGATILLALLGRTYDTGVQLDPLWAKNLTYFFGHETANLIMYLAAGAVYVLVPRYAGKPWKTSKAVVGSWLATLVLLVTAYSHHLYMDFVQPEWAQVISTISSSAAAIPVGVVTIYGGVTLVWGSRYRWTLSSTLLYLGFAGWAIGGTGAALDSVVPLNFRFHNTDWVVAHFHTYLLLTVDLLGVRLRRAPAGARRRAHRAARPLTLRGRRDAARRLRPHRNVVPRRRARSPAPLRDPAAGHERLQPGREHLRDDLRARLPRAAGAVRGAGPRRRRAQPLRHDEIMDSWTGRRYLSQRRRDEDDDAQPAALPAAVEPRGVPFATPAQLGLGAATAVVALAAFFPQVVDASETSAHYHHLDHAGQFLLGLALGATLGSLPAVARSVAGGFNLGLAAVLGAPAVMLLVMVPRFYEPLEQHVFYHALYHIAMAGLGLVVGLGSTRLGLVVGRFALLLAVGMAVMFAGTAGG